MRFPGADLEVEVVLPVAFRGSFRLRGAAVRDQSEEQGDHEAASRQTHHGILTLFVPTGASIASTKRRVEDLVSAPALQHGDRPHAQGCQAVDRREASSFPIAVTTGITFVARV